MAIAAHFSSIPLCFFPSIMLKMWKGLLKRMLTQNRHIYSTGKNTGSSHQRRKASVIVPLKLMEQHQKVTGTVDSSPTGTMQPLLLNLKPLVYTEVVSFKKLSRTDITGMVLLHGAAGHTAEWKVKSCPVLSEPPLPSQSLRRDDYSMVAVC